jgi:serine protease Do
MRDGGRVAGVLLPAVAVLGLAAGCASTGALPLTPRDTVIRQILPSNVQLRCERGNGARRAASGVVLGSDPTTGRTWILTTRHLLEPIERQNILVSVPGRKDGLTATVKAVSTEMDLALLEVAGLGLPGVRIKETVRLGDDVWIIAYPWGRRLTVVSGVVSQITATEGETAVEGPVRMVDGSVSYGASGGGVFDGPTGALIGVVEGYRTARMTLPDAPNRVLELPVPGETTVIAGDAILRFLTASGLPAENFVAK